MQLLAYMHVETFLVTRGDTMKYCGLHVHILLSIFYRLWLMFILQLAFSRIVSTTKKEHHVHVASISQRILPLSTRIILCMCLILYKLSGWSRRRWHHNIWTAARLIILAGSANKWVIWDNKKTIILYGHLRINSMFLSVPYNQEPDLFSTFLFIIVA